MAAEHGFKQEQKKDNKVDVAGKTPKNPNKKKRSTGKGSPTLDPALLQAIMMLLAQRGGEMPPDAGGGGGMPMGLPPGAVPMGPPAAGNPSMQGRMGMMPPMPGAMPSGGMPVR